LENISGSAVGLKKLAVVIRSEPVLRTLTGVHDRVLADSKPAGDELDRHAVASAQVDSCVARRSLTLCPPCRNAIRRDAKRICDSQKNVDVTGSAHEFEAITLGSWIARQSMNRTVSL
jgi:hypothetical protein